MCADSFFHSHVSAGSRSLTGRGMRVCKVLQSQGYSLLQAIVNSLFKWKYVASKIHRQWIQSSMKDGGIQNGQMQSYESKIYLKINLIFQ